MLRFAGNVTIVLFVPSKGKAVLLLSIMHHDATTEGDQQIPEIALHYNKTKNDADNTDHLATMAILKNSMLDVAGVSTFVI